MKPIKWSAKARIGEEWITIRDRKFRTVLNSVRQAFDDGASAVTIKAEYGIGDNSGTYDTFDDASKFMLNQQEDWRTGENP